MPNRKSLIRRSFEGLCILYFGFAVYGFTAIAALESLALAIALLVPVAVGLWVEAGPVHPAAVPAHPKTARRIQVAARSLELLGAAYGVCALCALPFVVAHSPRHVPALLAPLAFGALYAVWAALYAAWAALARRLAR